MSIINLDNVSNNVNPVYAVNAKSTVSAKYQFCSTQSIIAALEGDGWEIDSTTAKRTRKAENIGFQKHQVTMKHPRFSGEGTATLGRITPRLVLINDHTGGGSVKMLLGMFRLVCLNGLIIPEGEVQSARFRHSGKENLTVKVLAAAHAMINDYETKVLPVVVKLSTIMLNDQQIARFAEQAAVLVYGEEGGAALANASQLAYSRRAADNGNDLWSIFNRVQENALSGGLSRLGSNRRTRRVTGLDRNIDINESLMNLALDFAVAA